MQQEKKYITISQVSARILQIFTSRPCSSCFSHDGNLTWTQANQMSADLQQQTQKHLKIYLMT